MKALAGGVLVAVACSTPVLGQERDRSLERISLALHRPPLALRSVDPVETAAPKTFGVLSLVPPTGRGELVRVSVPIGALVSRAFKSVAEANRRRQEADARKRVAAELAALKAQARSPRP